MKPQGPVAHRKDYALLPIDQQTGAAFIRQHHYARGCSKTAVYWHGLFRSDVLVGAAQWLPPTRVCAESVVRELATRLHVRADWRRVLSLSRLAVAPTEPTNAESIFIGLCLRAIRTEGKWPALVTFADDSQGHTGTIYRATNWIELGKTQAKPRWVDAEGSQVSVLASKSRTVEQMRALGFRVEGKYAKTKFVQWLGSRSEYQLTSRAASGVLPK